MTTEGATAASRVPRSMALWARAQELIPGGTQLVSRRPTRYANGVSPVFAVRARGARGRTLSACGNAGGRESLRFRYPWVGHLGPRPK